VEGARLGEAEEDRDLADLHGGVPQAGEGELLREETDASAGRLTGSSSSRRSRRAVSRGVGSAHRAVEVDPRDEQGGDRLLERPWTREEALLRRARDPRGIPLLASFPDE
jgi:hypothetical protein